MYLFKLKNALMKMHYHYSKISFLFKKQNLKKVSENKHNIPIDAFENFKSFHVNLSTVEDT